MYVSVLLVFLNLRYKTQTHHEHNISFAKDKTSPHMKAMANKDVPKVRDENVDQYTGIWSAHVDEM